MADLQHEPWESGGIFERDARGKYKVVVDVYLYVDKYIYELERKVGKVHLTQLIATGLRTT